MLQGLGLPHLLPSSIWKHRVTMYLGSFIIKFPVNTRQFSFWYNIGYYNIILLIAAKPAKCKG
jgi:hypothetical protein